MSSLRSLVVVSCPATAAELEPPAAGDWRSAIKKAEGLDRPLLLLLYNYLAGRVDSLVLRVVLFA